MATKTASEAARILVHYIELALGDKLQGDMRAELGSVVDTFDQIDRELNDTRDYLAPRLPVGPIRRPPSGDQKELAEALKTISRPGFGDR